MDRTVATGTGYIGQYSPAVGELYESIDTCPDDLLLFMHHVPYTHRLHSGKTVIQYIYDSHYEGAAEVEQFLRDWDGLKGRVDDERFAEVRAQLDYQTGQAIVWRDAVTQMVRSAPRELLTRARVNNYPGRIEAESATLTGYVVKSVTPWETASGDGAVECPAASCTATFRYPAPLDLTTSSSSTLTSTPAPPRFRVRVGDRTLGRMDGVGSHSDAAA